MNKIAFFILGAFSGVAGTLYVVWEDSANQDLIANSNNNYTETSQLFTTNTPTKQTIINNSDSLRKPTETSGSPDVELMLSAFAANTENLFERKEFKDLAYLIRNDKNVAAQVRNKLLNSTSYEEKYALVNLLGQDNSQETVDLVIDMINKQDDESRRLGFELLGSMNIKGNQPELNSTLLNATYYESNPELLTDVIFRLSENTLDDATKATAIDRFQSFLTSNNSTVKARAIDGLSQLGDQALISTTVKHYIHDSNESVRVSAISAAFELDSHQMDDDIVSTLTKITKNLEEPESVRNMASAVLGSQKSAL